MEDILSQLKEKYDSQKQDLQVHLQGLLYSRPINYWDYVEVDTLLSLQKPRTHFTDETTFIVYHQVTELVLKLIRHELNQLDHTGFEKNEEWEMRLERCIQYVSLLSNSFSIMNKGMSYEDYNKFRLSLTPASGFQSAQFRFIELMCTGIDNLLHRDFRGKKHTMNIQEVFDHLYWKEAGLNHRTGEKSMTLLLFEEKYQRELIQFAEDKIGKNINDRLEESMLSGTVHSSLLEKCKAFDKAFNISWPMVHLETANTYLNKHGENKAATGASEWQKYLHPKFQQRRFFPSLYSEKELIDWGQ